VTKKVLPLLLTWALMAVLGISSVSVYAQEPIPLERQGNTFVVECRVNGTAVKMILDTGADLVAIPYNTFLKVKRNSPQGSIREIGPAEMRDAAGNITKVMKVRFERLEIAGQPVFWVEAMITPGLDALLGQSVLAKLGLIQIDYGSETLLFFPHREKEPKETMVSFPLRTKVGRLELSGSMSLSELKKGRIGADNQNWKISSAFVTLDKGGKSWLMLSYYQNMAHAGYDRLVLFAPRSNHVWQFAAYFPNAKYDRKENALSCYDVIEDDELTYFYSCRACNVQCPRDVWPICNYKVENGKVTAVPQRIPLDDIFANLEFLSKRPIPVLNDTGFDDGTRKAFATNIVAFYRRTLDLNKTHDLYFRYYRGSDAVKLWGEISSLCRTNVHVRD
jgi:hypothetical protein